MSGERLVSEADLVWAIEQQTPIKDRMWMTNGLHTEDEVLDIVEGLVLLGQKLTTDQFTAEMWVTLIRRLVMAERRISTLQSQVQDLMTIDDGD